MGAPIVKRWSFPSAGFGTVLANDHACILRALRRPLAPRRAVAFPAPSNKYPLRPSVSRPQTGPRQLTGVTKLELRGHIALSARPSLAPVSEIPHNVPQTLRPGRQPF